MTRRQAVEDSRGNRPGMRQSLGMALSQPTGDPVFFIQVEAVGEKDVYHNTDCKPAPSLNP